LNNNKKIYVNGALLGVLAILSALATTFLLGRTNYLGTSTSFVRAAGFIEQLFSHVTTSSLSYYVRLGIKVDWQFTLVIGILIGSFISSVANRTFKIEFIPPIWRERFGDSIAKRAAFAFIGGVIAIYGARLADGCPSGHGLSGVMQLSVSSIIALFLFFLAGVLTAQAIYGRRGGGQ
jgi:uncharacterized membrane protein YedE/YeeE